MDTEEKARVAVSSREFASAAASTFRTPPARATETSCVLLGLGDWVTGAGSGVGVCTTGED